eukprot:scaffold23496_cov66-Phaeocystis_antarctica.AAC.1
MTRLVLYHYYQGGPVPAARGAGGRGGSGGARAGASGLQTRYGGPACGTCRGKPQTQGSNPTDEQTRVPGRSATHTFEPYPGLTGAAGR